MTLSLAAVSQVLCRVTHGSANGMVSSDAVSTPCETGVTFGVASMARQLSRDTLLVLQSACCGKHGITCCSNHGVTRCCSCLSIWRHRCGACRRALHSAETTPVSVLDTNNSAETTARHKQQRRDNTGLEFEWLPAPLLFQRTTMEPHMPRCRVFVVKHTHATPTAT